MLRKSHLVPLSPQLPDRWRFPPLAGNHCIQIGIILILGLAAYANSLSVPLQFDDDPTVRIVNNLNNNLFSLQGLIHRARWFTDVTFSLNRSLHGERVFGYHLVNLAIHLSSATVIYLFFHRAIEALKRPFHLHGDDLDTTFLQRFIPFTAAALFVCHPVQTQAVTYISQRYTSLATLLYAGSLLSYLQARLSYGDDTGRFRAAAWGGAGFLLALLAMRSKEIAFTLPLMAVAAEALLFGGRLLKNRLFLALAAGLLLVIPLQLVYTHSAGTSGDLLQNIQSAATETSTISRGDYLLTQIRVVATYLRLLILPVNQNLDYDYPVYHSLFNLPVLAALLLHLSLTGLGVILFIRSRRLPATVTPAIGIRMRLACLGIAWFYLALSVESSLVPIRDVIYEHRVYLPSIGFFMAIAAGISACGQRCRTAVTGGVILICFVLTAGTIARNRKWSDEMVLWQDVLRKSPDKARPNYSVGLLYYRRFMPEKALPHLVRALELEPARQKHWNTLNATVSITKGFEGRGSAGREYDTIAPAERPAWLANGHNSLGLAYEFLGNRHLAGENYRKAATLDPSLDLAWYNLALLAARRSDIPTVESSLRSLKALNPQLAANAVKAIRETLPSVQFVFQ